jgi:hypothetical protein
MTSTDTYDIEQNKKIEIYQSGQRELFAKLLEITKWHASLQVQFDKDLQEQELKL